MEGSNVNSVLITAVLAVAGFISVQVWDSNKQINQNQSGIAGIDARVARIERALERAQTSYLKKENRYEFSKPPS